MHKLRKLIWSAGVLLAVTGCATSRTVVLNPATDLVRLGPDVTGHVYFFRDGKWQLTGDRIRLPEGWYAGALPAPTK
jgi:hypothetical protein